MRHPTVELLHERLTPEKQMARANRLVARCRERRSVRDYSDEHFPIELIYRCIEVAGTAPSGANKQPWTFCVVTDPAIKAQIRRAAERQERAFYGGKAPQSWLDDLEPLGTDAQKEFIERAPALVVLFAQQRGDDGGKHYYVSESVGIAAGFFIHAVHHVGLTCLTHTPSPMGFLRELLGRPSNERAYLLIPVGLPVEGCCVPDIGRKPLREIMVHVQPAKEDTDVI